MLRRALFALLVLGFAISALAGPKEDLHAEHTKFLAQTSFKGSSTGTIDGKATHTTIEFQAPDRYQIRSEGRPAIVLIGDAMYIDINGHTKKVASAAANMIAQYRDPNFISLREGRMSAEDLGQESVGGVPAHKYHYSITEPQPSTGVIWVSNASGLPIQRQRTGKIMGKQINATITYSNFNDPSIQISAPN